LNVLTILTPYVLSILSVIVGWFIGKRKRNNDFISELQASIDLLSEKYTETLKELISVKKQNAELMINQNSMALDMKELRTENAGLKREIEDLTTKLQDVKIITRQAK